MTDRASTWPRFPWYLALASLAVYAATLCPSVYGGDSSELAAAGATLGVLHSPGYPLYTILANVASLVPIGEVAARVNFLSALCSAIAGGFLATLAWWWTGSRPASLLAWSTWAFAPLVWRYSVVAEVFALNNLLWAALLVLSWRYAIARSRVALFLGAFVAGLGVAHHPTIVFGSVPLVAWHVFVIVREQRGRAWKDVACCAAAFAAGLLPYLYLPWAAARDPAISWGNPESLDGVLYMLLRKEVGTFSLVHRGSVQASSLAGLQGFLAQWANDFLWIGAFLAIVGWIHALRQPGALRAHSALLLFSTFAYVAVFALKSSLDLSAPLLHEIVARFWQWTYLAFALHMALGASAIAAWARARGSNALAARALFLYAPLALFLARIPIVWRAESNAGDRRFAAAARSVLESLPPGALVLSAGDMWTNLLRYVQLVDRVRPDVVVLDRAFLTRDWYPRTVRAHHPAVELPPGVLRAERQPGTYEYAEFLARNIERLRIFQTEGQNAEQIGESWRARFEEHPFGVVSELVPVGSTSADAARDGLARSFAWLSEVDRRIGPRTAHDEVWMRELYGSLDRAAGRSVRGVMRLGATSGPQLLERAKAELARIRSAHAGEPPPWTLLLELELYAGNAPLSDADRRVFERAYADFLARAGPDDVNSAQVKRLYRRVQRQQDGPERSVDPAKQ